MITKIFSTDILPVVGGASGAAVAADTEKLFTAHDVIVFVIMTIAGAVIGYLVKLLMDKIFKKHGK